jgi:shikimate dehydrogenase
MDPAAIRLVLLGDPIGHSRLPAIMNAALEARAIAYRYGFAQVTADRFESLVETLRDRGCVGANVTMPHKRAAYALADELTPAAAAIGAVNTLAFAAGSIVGDNTDAGGILDALGVDPTGLRVVVLGAGGAARAAVWALVNAGAAEVSVWSRRPASAQALARELDVRAIPRPHTADLLVNATPVGLDPATTVEQARTSLALQALDPPSLVLDLVYGAHPTAVCRWATAGRARAIDGLEVLIRQGARSFQRWTATPAPLDAMRQAASRTTGHSAT